MVRHLQSLQKFHFLTSSPRLILDGSKLHQRRYLPGMRTHREVELKTYLAIFVSLFASAAIFAVSETHAAAANAGLAGAFRCGPNMKVCQWSGETFTITQAGNHLDIKNEKGEQGTAIVTSAISISAGPPWNMLGVISGDGKTISWSNGSEWRKG
jgi:hypothetical protein